jgi:hypothetical protein
MERQLVFLLNINVFVIYLLFLYENSEQNSNKIAIVHFSIMPKCNTYFTIHRETLILRFSRRYIFSQYCLGSNASVSPSLHC